MSAGSGALSLGCGISCCVLVISFIVNITLLCLIAAADSLMAWPRVEADTVSLTGSSVGTLNITIKLRLQGTEILGYQGELTELNVEIFSVMKGANRDAIKIGKATLKDSLKWKLDDKFKTVRFDMLFTKNIANSTKLAERLSADCKEGLTKMDLEFPEHKVDTNIDYTSPAFSRDLYASCSSFDSSLLQVHNFHTEAHHLAEVTAQGKLISGDG